MATLTGNGAEEDAVPAIIKDGITKQPTDRTASAPCCEKANTAGLPSGLRDSAKRWRAMVARAAACPADDNSAPTPPARPLGTQHASLQASDNAHIAHRRRFQQTHRRRASRDSPFSTSALPIERGLLTKITPPFATAALISPNTRGSSDRLT